MKKVLTILLVLIFGICVLSGCGEEEIQSTDTATTETTEQTDKNTENIMPGISGSNSADVILNLEDTGFPKAKAQVTDTGVIYSETSDIYSYDLDVNINHEISYAMFYVYDTKDTEGYLQYCAQLINVEPEKMSKWVEDNKGTKKTKTVNDAIFTLGKSDNAITLEVKSTGYDKFTQENL